MCVISHGKAVSEKCIMFVTVTVGSSKHRELMEKSANRNSTKNEVAIEEDAMLGDDEYESLPASAGVKTFMMAGAMAGILEHCACYPLDSIKTRMQSILPQETCRYKGVTDAFRTISKTEGNLRFIRGLNVVLLGAGPAHALYFSCYETMKKKLSSSLHSKAGQSHLANGKES